MTMRIGVVVPLKNAVQFIEAALSAIFSQTRRPDRVVIVDNGSTDGTLALLDRLQKTMPFELLHEPQAGASAARDTGWRSLNDCHLIGFCDADDVWHLDKLERQVQLFSEDSSADLVCVYCANRMIDQHGNEISRSGMPSMKGYVHGQVAQGAPVLGSMSAALVRRDALDAIGGFDRSLLADEDLDMFIRLSRRGRFDFVPDYLTALRVHTAQTSRLAQRLLKSKGQIINKYPEIYSVNSPFIESVRIEHMRIDLESRSSFGRYFVGALYPLFFGYQVRCQTTGRASILLFPGLIGYSCWLLGRVLIFVSNKLAFRLLGSI